MRIKQLNNDNLLKLVVINDKDTTRKQLAKELIDKNVPIDILINKNVTNKDLSAINQLLSL